VTNLKTAQTARPRHFRRFALFFAVLWTLLVATSLTWNLLLIEDQAEYLSSEAARDIWNKDQSFRQWGIRHGGLYVRENERTPPSPFLAHIPHRDVITADGTKLTLMAPASMMRQMTEEFEELYGIKGRITGQVQLNPNNKPDDWELAALKKFDEGYKEISEFTQIDGDPYFRLMKPMYMRDRCMACHGHLGIKVGDVRGGVSVSVPLKPYLTAAKSTQQVLFTSHGAVWIIGLAGIGFITFRSKQQEQTEKALTKSSREWDYAMDFFEDAVYLVDLDDRVIRVNQAFYKMTGLTPEQTVGKKIGDVMHPGGESIPCPVCAARLDRRDEIIAMEPDHPDNPTGLPVEVMVRIIRDEDDTPLGVLMGIHDLSRSRRAAEEINEREQQKRDLLNSTAEGIYGSDLDGNCFFANPSCIELLGYSTEEELMGQNMHTLLHHSHEDGSEYNEHDCRIHNAFRTSSEVHCDTEVFWRADGSCFPVEYWSYPVLRENRVVGAVVTFFDITERRKTEYLLRRSQKMDALGQLTGGIAHDFNNQLGVVSGYLEMLDKNTDPDNKSSKWIKTSRKATERCVNLTRQLLNFSRQQQTNLVLLDLQKEIDELKEIIERTLTPAIPVHYEIADDIAAIMTSKGDLDDALLNLVINARDAMPNGGQLTINIHNDHFGEDRMQEAFKIEAGDYVVISVSDTGHGIPEEIKENIFDPFFTTKAVGKGTGLGMSMVYGFVKRNNGYINIYSETDKGTTINLYLPYAEPEHQHTDSNEVSLVHTGRGNNEIVLVVEDEPQLRELAIELLQAAGYDTLTADDSNSAMSIIQSDAKIDLLFCDVIMPGGMNGYQIAENARELRPELKIQLTSGLAEKSLATEQQAELSLNLLPKPYSQHSLLECISKHFNK